MGRENNVKVYCRFRPPNKEEMLAERKDPKKKSICIDIEDDHTVLVEGDTPKRYILDKIFQPLATQDEVFENTMKPLIKQLIEGYNVTCIAYGQTGSGKSHTMLGPSFCNPLSTINKKKLDKMTLLELINEDDLKLEDEEEDFEENENGDENNLKKEENALEEYLSGIVQRSIKELFSLIRKDKTIISTRLSCSYIEIYNEKIQDLLVRKKKETCKEIYDEKKKKKKKKELVIQSNNGVVYVNGATSVTLNSPNKIIKLMKIGNLNRVIAETKANKESSRSHAIFIITTDLINIREERISSQLYLVDLAGSEKVEKTEALGVRLKEAGNINKSLLSRFLLHLIIIIIIIIIIIN